MKQHLVPLATALLRPILRRCNRRLPLLERLLDLQLAPHEFRSVQVACERSNATLGEYYLWKLTQLSVIASFRRLSKDATRALVATADHTDYRPMQRALETGRGLLVAIPHHGQFVLSIIGLIEEMIGKREIYVFYEAPANHSSNEIFDLLYERLFGDLADQVGILHNNRQGLTRALRELQRGSVVVIMPDVFKDVHDAYQLPLFGSSRNVMLGTALLARRTGAAILPMVSQPFNSGMEFSTAFAERIEPHHASAEQIEAGFEAEATIHADYRTMAALFSAFEPLMEPGLIHWQYSRTHFAKAYAFNRMTGRELDEAVSLFFKDPRIRVDLGSSLQLD